MRKGTHLPLTKRCLTPLGQQGLCCYGECSRKRSVFCWDLWHMLPGQRKGNGMSAREEYKMEEALRDTQDTQWFGGQERCVLIPMSFKNLIAC